MNREQANNILDAYISMKKKAAQKYFPDDSDDCSGELREIILDAMTEYKVVSYPISTNPIVIPYPNTSYPVHTKPIVTCTGESTNGYACGS